MTDETIEVDRKALVDVSKRLKHALQYWGQPYGDPTEKTVREAHELLQLIYNGNIEPMACLSGCEEEFTSASRLWSHLHYNHGYAANKKDWVTKQFIRFQLNQREETS